MNTAIVVRLEAGGEPVVGQDWRRHITQELQEGGASKIINIGDALKTLMYDTQNRCHLISDSSPHAA